MALKPCDDWKAADSPSLCGVFAAASLSPSSASTQILRVGEPWHFPPIEGYGFNFLSIRNKDLRFLTSDSLSEVREEEKAPRVIYSAPSGRHVLRAWESPTSTEILLVQGTFDHDENNELVLINLKDGVVKSKFRVPDGGICQMVSWPGACFFVSYHVTRELKRIDRITLSSGKTETVLETDILHEVAVSNEGNLVHWPLCDYGPIEELINGSKVKRLTEFGWCPSFSRNGDMAFLMGDHTLWIRYKDGTLSRVASSWSETDPAQTEAPFWCPCGNHVAALLAGGFQDKWLARDLVFADLVRREVSILPQLILDPAANRNGRAWLRD